jgi:RimJ/RimL family protein N-acetyltransferase
MRRENAMQYTIRSCTADDIDAWHSLLDREWPENGTDGIYFSPFARDAVRPPRVPAQWAERLAAPLTRPEWMRAWLAFTPGGADLAGYARLSGGRIASELHRCTLAIGLLRAHHRRGVGTALLGSAIAWAREQPALAWIDLGVFEGNVPAKALYRKMGFVLQGRSPDRFRVEGRAIEDLQMALRLRDD